MRELHYFTNNYQVTVTIVLKTFLETLLAMLVVGCSLRPTPVLPYANDITIFRHTETANSQTQQRRFKQTKERRQQIARELKKLIGRDCDSTKWRHILMKKLNSQKEPIRKKSLKSMTDSVDLGGLKTADLIYFDRLPRAPLVAVVLMIEKQGLIKAIAPVNGRIRLLRLSPQMPHIRRKDGRIYNSFIRSKTETDKDRRYLGGSLIREYRTAIGL